MVPVMVTVNDRRIIQEKNKIKLKKRWRKCQIKAGEWNDDGVISVQKCRRDGLLPLSSPRFWGNSRVATVFKTRLGVSSRQELLEFFFFFA